LFIPREPIEEVIGVAHFPDRGNGPPNEQQEQVQDSLRYPAHCFYKLLIFTRDFFGSLESAEFVKAEHGVSPLDPYGSVSCRKLYAAFVSRQLFGVNEEAVLHSDFNGGHIEQEISFGGGKRFELLP
jgi:hypothetical protein